MNMWHQYQIVLLLDGIQLKTYLLPHLVHPGLLWPLSGSPFHGSRPSHELLMLVVELLFLLGCWKLVTAELLSLGNKTPSGLVPHSGNILDLFLALGYLVVLVGCWGQEGEVSSCSASDIGFLLVGCVDGTVVAGAEGIASRTVVDADAGSDADAGVLEYDSA
jgi:hypothetical protein